MDRRIGTSGWSYREWQPDFYPPGLAPADFLRHYAGVLNACEINATHYRVPRPDTVARWADAVPDDFRFAIKAHRRLTDPAAMDWGPPERAFLSRFLDALGPLGDRLGPLLLQFADEHERDDDALESVLRSLPPGVAVAIELRHPSWAGDEVSEHIAGAGAARCVGETAGGGPGRPVPGPFAYVRLRAEHYDDPARSAWAASIAAESTMRPIWVIARHEGIPAGDPHAGVGLAEWLSTRTSNE